MQGEGVAGREDTARALWYAAPGRAEIRPETLGELAPGAVRVRATHGAISRGTEALIMAGRVPESEFQRMRAPFMGGSFPFPVKYGYATVGRIEAGPTELIGRAVFTLFPHQTLFDVPAEAVLPLPDAVPAPRAVLAANMETALNAVWDVEPGHFPNIAVVGAGVVGALAGLLFHRLMAAAVTLVDVDPRRAEIARALGLSFALPGEAASDRDLVVHASASAAGLSSALDLAGDEATVLELSWYGAGTVAVPLGGAFHSRRLQLVSSQVGMVPTERRARWSNRRRMEAALRLLMDPALDVLISGETAFWDLPQHYREVLDRPETLCHRVFYD